MKDKLIEILYNGFYVSPKDDLNGVVQKAADYLIAHGVTVQADVTDINVGDKKPLTNGDRTRAMTDEELADFLEAVTNACFERSNPRCPNCPMKWSAFCDIDGWLKQPAKEEV